MATYTLTPTPFQTVEGYVDGLWGPISGCLVYTYMAGTSTPATTWTDVGGLVANTNPIEADSSGRFVAFLAPGSSYKFVYCLPVTPIPPPTSPPSAFRTQDNIAAVPSSSAAVDIDVTWGESVTANQLVYQSDGSNSLVPGRYYIASSTNAYSSSTPAVGFAVANGSAGTQGSVRQGGVVTGLSGLTPGALYYAGAAGAITATAPANNYRLVGQAQSSTTLTALCDPPVPRVDVGICEGRLTLTTGVPVTTTNVTAATTLYWAPYGGNRVTLFDGTNWTIRSFAQLSIAVPASTSQMYDIWVFDNGGTLTLELLAWTNDTTRATALTTQDGVYVKTGALTRRYLGSFRTTGVSGQTEDSFTSRLVWNYYNRVDRPMRRLESTASWTYNNATIRQANAAAANQLAIVVGVAEDNIDVSVLAASRHSTSTLPRFAYVGEDSTTAGATGSTIGVIENQYAAQALARLSTIPAVGYHFYAWLEKAYDTTATFTFYGVAADYGQSGMMADWRA